VSFSLLAVLLAAGARLDAGVETGGHLRSPMLDEPDTARLAEVTPSLTALYQEPGLGLTARYAPRLFLGDVRGIRHDALLGANWQESRNTNLAFSQSFHYGRSEFTWDPGARRPFDNLEALLPLVPDELFSDTEAGFSRLLSRNLTLNVGGGYLVYGGASRASQDLLPLQQGPQLYASLDQELTRNDRISTALFASQTFVSGGRRNSLVELSESWRRLLGPSTRSTFSAGVSGVRRTAPDYLSLDVYPVGSAELEHDLLARTQRLELKALAAFAPHRSRVTGDLVERAELQASARWVVRENLSIRGRGAAARELGAARLLLSAIDVVYRPRPDLSFTVGAEALWQHLPAQPGSLAFHWVAFTALNVAVRDLL
jgi:hypothetical protein